MKTTSALNRRRYNFLSDFQVHRADGAVVIEGRMGPPSEVGFTTTWDDEGAPWATMNEDDLAAFFDRDDVSLSGVERGEIFLSLVSAAEHGEV